MKCSDGQDDRIESGGQERGQESGWTGRRAWRMGASSTVSLPQGTKEVRFRNGLEPLGNRLGTGFGGLGLI